MARSRVWNQKRTARRETHRHRPPQVVRIRPEDTDLNTALGRAARAGRFSAAPVGATGTRDTSWTPHGGARRFAVLVTHGMGQQLPFETAATVAEGLITQNPEFAGEMVPLAARTRSTPSGRRQHLEFQARDASGDTIEVHVHEAYWAPLTEGRVHLRDVLRFLYSGALNTLRTWRFTRYMFGRTVDCKVSPLSHLRLLLTTIILSFFVLLNVVVACTLVGFVLREGFNLESVTWPSAALVEVMNRVVAFFLATTASFGVFVWLAVAGKKRLRKFGSWRSGVLRWCWCQTANVAQGAAWLWYAATIACFAAMALAIVVEQRDPTAFQGWVNRLQNWPLRVEVPFWLLMFMAFGFMRKKLVQYMGDVAAYVSPHVLDRFLNIRQNIKSWVFDAASEVYRRKRPDGRHEYDGVILVGHSLGSVVIYDVLNALLNEDEANGRAARVVERTRLLLTFGSPLDKTAFIFSQHRRPMAETRGLMAAAVQPLICNYERFRCIRWVNVHSPRDPVSDALRLYDDRAATEFPKARIRNEYDCDARIPLVAHVEYWDNPCVYEHLWSALGVATKREGPPPRSGSPTPVERGSKTVAT